MFCPKCGTKNPDSGKFCRNCGTDLSPVSSVLSGEHGSNQIQNADSATSAKLTNRKGKPITWESAMSTLFGGLAFIGVTIALANSVIGTGWWFWMLIPALTMIGTGLAQIIQIKNAEKVKPLVTPNEIKREISARTDAALPASKNDYIEIEELLSIGKSVEAVRVYQDKFGVGTKEAKEEVDHIASNRTAYHKETGGSGQYTKPQNSIYDTGELMMPPSVTEGTTRHLELDSEGKTMTLPEKDRD